MSTGTNKERLTQNNNKIDDITAIARNLPSGGGEANIFAQTTEPTTKKGIWLQADRTIEHIYGVDSISIAGTWEADGTYTDIPYGFYRGSVVAVGTDVYILGGNNSTTAYKYDTITNTYTSIRTIPFSFSYGQGSAVAVGTDIYLFGGTNNYKYDTTTNTYTQMTNVPANTYNGVITVAIGNDIYWWGNTNDSSPMAGYKYDTTTDTYTSITSYPSVPYASATVVGTNIYFFGGYTSNWPRNTAYKYDTLTDTFTSIETLPSSMTSSPAVAVGTDIYLFGGNGNGLDTQTVARKYDTTTDTYTSIANIPFSFYIGDAVLVGNKIFLFGGQYMSSKVQCLVAESSTFLDNSVVIGEGTSYETELYNDSKVAMPLYYAFADAWFYTTANGIETNIPTYYGDGTNWIKIKN